MWRTGVIPYMGRATIITVGRLAAYDQCKHLLLESGTTGGIPARSGTSLMAAFITPVLPDPVHVARTQLMNQKFIGGKPEHTRTVNVTTSMVNCMVRPSWTSRASFRSICSG